MNTATRFLSAFLCAASISSCSVPPVMIPANASCEELLFLYNQQREEWRRVSRSVYEVGAREQLERIESAIDAKGCLTGGSALPKPTPSTAPTDPLEAAYAALYAIAPVEFERYAASGEALQSIAPNETQAYNSAGLALFIAAPAEFVIHSHAARNLQRVAPRAFSAISAEDKVLYAYVAPEQYAESVALGEALRIAAPLEFDAYNLAWKALRNTAAMEFEAMADAQKILYVAAPVQFTELDTAGVALYAAAPREYMAFEYASLQAGVVEALRAAAPREFTAYAGTPPGSESQAAAFELLAAAAPREIAALSVLQDALAGSN